LSEGIRNLYQTFSKGETNPVLFMAPARSQKKSRLPSLADFVVKIGPPKLTRFEKARIIGARSLQIAMGAPSFVPMEGGYRGPIEVATAEMEEDALPVSIRRTLPNGATQDIPIAALIK
jgi:DNA-directed RNA polymerase subunit K/omega